MDTDAIFSLNLDEDTVLGFMNTLTVGEFTTIAPDDEHPEESLYNLAVIAARRLGHHTLTREDIGHLPIAQLAPLIEKAAAISPTAPDVLGPLLLDISK